MTLPDHGPMDQAVSDYEGDVSTQFAALQAAADQAQQALADAQAANTELQQALTEAQQALADCQAQQGGGTPTPPALATVFGANCGGYSGESAAHAFSRIDGHWHLGMVRSWANNIFDRANAPYASTGRRLCIELSADPTKVASGSLDAQIAAALGTLLDGDIVSYNHEYDIHTDPTGVAKQAAQRFAQLCRDHKPDGAFSTIILTGGAYIVPKVDTVRWDQCWPDDPTGIDYVGSDSYQHGQTDAGADTADYVLSPVYAAAAQLGNRPVLFGELGARSGGYPISDATRAKFLTDAIAMMKAKPTAGALYYESYRGPLGPWNLLETSSTSGVFSPQAAQVWADACSTNP